MAAMSNYLENALVNAVLRNTAYTSPTTVYVGLYTSDPTDANTGTEVAGNGYARQAATFATPSNGASTTSANLIAALLTASSSNAFPLVDNANRYTILWDSYKSIGVHRSDATQSYAGSPTVATLDYYRKINQITQYSGTTAAIGSIQNGALWFVTIGDQGAGTGGVFNGRVRVRFTDQ